jgi:hypothetical protein
MARVSASAGAGATTTTRDPPRAMELSDSLARGEFATVRAETYDGWVTTKKKKKFAADADDDRDGRRRERESAATMLRDSDVFTIESASVRTWGWREADKARRSAREEEEEEDDDDETRTRRRRVDAIKEGGAGRSAIVDVTRAMYEARRALEGVGKTTPSEARQAGRERKERRAFGKLDGTSSCALCRGSETPQWRTLVMSDDGTRDDPAVIVCNKCYARTRRARNRAAALLVGARARCKRD